MRYFIFIILPVYLLVLSCDKEDISQSQARSFIKYYTNYPEFTAADVAVTSAGYAILGTATDPNGTWICLIRTDAFGNSTDSARIYGIARETGAENRAYCLKALDDGGFAILGSILNPSSAYRSVYFIRTNSAGDTVFTRTISSNGNLEAKYFDVTPDESFYMTGYIGSSGNKDIWWFGIDSQGRDIRNQRLFGFASDDEGTHLSILPDGRLIITGYITRPTETRAFIIRTDESSVPVAFYELDDKNLTINESGNCLLPLDSENYMLLVTRGNGNNTHLNLKNIRMAASSQDTVWTKDYVESNAETGKFMLKDSESLYILGTTTLSSSNTSITLTTTDLSGRLSHRSEFGLGGKLSASAFQRTSDDGFIIAGTNTHPELNVSSIALIKTE